MSELKLRGKIKQIGEIQTFDSGFTKVEFVITTDDQYPQDVKFEAIKEKAEQLIQYNKVGDDVDVSFNVRGNEYNGKYYVNLQSWKVFKADATSEAGTVADNATVEAITDDGDGLPF